MDALYVDCTVFEMCESFLKSRTCGFFTCVLFTLTIWPDSAFLGHLWASVLAAPLGAQARGAALFTVLLRPGVELPACRSCHIFQFFRDTLGIQTVT